jgi:hypothetical protein
LPTIHHDNDNHVPPPSPPRSPPHVLPPCRALPRPRMQASRLKPPFPRPACAGPGGGRAAAAETPLSAARGAAGLRPAHRAPRPRSASPTTEPCLVAPKIRFTNDTAPSVQHVKPQPSRVGA